MAKTVPEPVDPRVQRLEELQDERRRHVDIVAAMREKEAQDERARIEKEKAQWKPSFIQSPTELFSSAEGGTDLCQLGGTRRAATTQAPVRGTSREIDTQVAAQLEQIAMDRRAAAKAKQETELQKLRTAPERIAEEAAAGLRKPEVV